MRLVLLISVACVYSTVYSAPLDVRHAKEISSRLHRRQATHEAGYPGYPGHSSSPSQYISSQSAVLQSGSTSSQTSYSAGWNSSPGAPSTAQGGQQQLATQESAQVVSPVQASHPSTTQTFLTSADTKTGSSASAAAAPQSSASSYPSMPGPSTAADKTFISNGAPASPLQSSAGASTSITFTNQTFASGGSSALGTPAPQPSVSSYTLTGAVPSNSSADNGYPVYFVSNPEEPNSQQQPSQSDSNSTINQPVLSSPLINTSSQSNNDDSYPVYYVGNEKEKHITPESKMNSNTSLLSATTTRSSSISHADNYPVYYVTSYNKETPQAPKATNSNSSITYGNKSLSANTASVPVYNVGGQMDMNAAGEFSQTKAVANSPVSYKIINSTTAYQNVTMSSSSSSPAPPAAVAPAAAPTTAHTSDSQAATQPAATSYNHPSNEARPAYYQNASATSPPSTNQQAYNYYGYPASPPSPATYQRYGAPSPATYSPSLTASQAGSSNSGYPAYQASAAPSPAQSYVTQPAANYNSATAPVAAASPAPAPAPAPVPAPAPAPVPSNIVISGVSSSPPFPPSSPGQSPTGQSGTSSNPATAPASAPSSYRFPGVSSSLPFPQSSQSSSSPGKDQTTVSTQVSNASSFNQGGSANAPATIKQPTLPELEPEYENASYVIATPPEKDTVLFLPSASFLLSSDHTQDENSTSVSMQTNSSTANISSSEQVTVTAELNATLPGHPISTPSTNTANITIPATQPAMISNQSTGNNNSMALPPPLNATQEEIVESPIIRIPENITLPGWELENTTFSNMTFISNSSIGSSATTSAAENPIASTAPKPPPPALNNKTVTSHTFNIPLGPLLNSLAVTTPPHTTKPPRPHFFTTRPPKPAPPPGTTKPPPVAVHPTTKPTDKAKEWGFGDKYLASQNQRARHRNVIFDGIAGDSQSFSNYQVLSQQEVFFPRKGRK